MKVATLDQFVEELKTFPYFEPDGEPNRDWILVLADNWVSARIVALNAARAAATEVGLDAARSAAWDAAQTAAKAAGLENDWEQTWDHIRTVARESSWAAARTAATDAAWAAPWDLAWHAADYAVICVLSKDLDIDPKHFETVRRRLEVWRKGYALMAEVDGTLYVYGIHGG